MRRICVLLLLLPLLPLQASEQKASNVTIRLHAEGKKEEDTFVTPIDLTNPPKRIYIRKVPIVTERDIVSFYAFPASDGSLGAYFWLDADGTNKLEQHTTEALDTLVVAMINGRVASALQVDKKIRDGMLYIPNGFLPIEIAELQTKFPVRGKEKDFAEQKKKATEALKELQLKQKAAVKPTPKPAS